jgi:hypothetical protein
VKSDALRLLIIENDEKYEKKNISMFFGSFPAVCAGATAGQQ